jgi:hypothetical protein
LPTPKKSWFENYATVRTFSLDSDTRFDNLFTSAAFREVTAAEWFGEFLNRHTPCAIPTLASNSKHCLDKELQIHRPKVPAKVPATF